ncbi:hypothetical protein K439DRAFT_1627372 [Ramaria rubella]|nr:hypothetical protein K439DRAFT_1627372 [Ramaria rubella]
MDDGWGDAFDSPIPVAPTKKAPSITPKKPSIARALSPRPAVDGSDDGWETPDTTRSRSPKPLVAPSMAGMSKEEKAAELARRREERKQVCFRDKTTSPQAGANV